MSLHEADKPKPQPVPKIPCPQCGEWDSKVRDGRPDPRGRGYRRKRVCQACGMQFITIERAA